MRRVACLLVCFCVLFTASTVAVGAPPVRNRIVGTIRLNGCILEPGELSLTAVPTKAYVPSQKRKGRRSAAFFAARTGGVRQASLRADRVDPRLLHFSFDRLVPRRSYVLAVELNEPTCGRISWQVPDQGLVVAGQAQAVRIEGFALRSILEVLGPAVGREEETWVGADHLDFTHPEAGVRRFRFRTELPDVTRAELQISTERFPLLSADAGSCGEPRADAVLYRQTFEVIPREWTEIPPVDFYGLLQDGRTLPPRDGRC